MDKSELILNSDGSVYHLKLKPENLSSKIILVGDPFRVDKITKHFEKIEFEVQNREFKSVTGYYNSNRITVISTGIGSGNIDIVLNELDALVNIELDEASYEKFLKEKTIAAIKKQEEIDIDVIVHGEFERNDMVEYFGVCYRFLCIRPALDA